MGPKNPSRLLVPLRSAIWCHTGHLMAYRTPRVWGPACVLATHVCWSAITQNEKNRQKKHRKNRPGLLLRRLLSFHCPFTDQRCLDIWFYNGPFFGKLQPLAPLWGDWALPFAKLCPHHCTGWSEAPPWNLPVALVCGGVLTAGYAWQTAIAT